MPRAAVLGKPIAHSLSPVLHNAAYRALGLAEWSYVARECEADGLDAVLATADESWCGFSCTMPVKEAALGAARTRSRDAEVVGAANTLTRAAGGGWHADNTDIAGMVSAVQELAGAPTRMLVLGAGGTARAAMAAAARWGLAEVDIAVRSAARAGQAVEAARRLGLAATVQLLDDPALADIAAAADLTVSTLPPGAADPYASLPIAAGHALLDVVYVPWPTALAHHADQRGAVVITGAAMLLHQAADQVRLMTGFEPPVAAMRLALRAMVPPGVV